MENYTINKFQIEKLAEEDAIVKSCLIEWFPEAFKKELKVWKWYKDKKYPQHIFYVTNFEEARYNYFGFNTVGTFKKNDWYNADGWFEEATPEELKSAMTKELIKQYGEDWENVKIKCLCDKINWYNSGNFDVEFNHNNIWNRNGMIFKDGIFAEVLD